MRGPARIELALAAALLASCAEGVPLPASFADLAFETVVPPGWSKIGQEISNRRSLFSLKIEDLAGAQRTFLANLPGSIEPELENWTRHSFGSATRVAQVDTSVGGEPALAVEYVAVARLAHEPTHVRYWVVRRDDALYLFRGVIAPGRLDQDAAAIDAIIAGIRFLPPPDVSATRSDASVNLD